MKRMICGLILFHVLSLFTFDVRASKWDNSKAVLQSCRLENLIYEIDAVNEYTDIRDFLLDHKSVEQFLHKDNTIICLCDLLEDDRRDCDDIDILILLSYIESGFSIYDIDALSRSLTQVTIAPSCGKTITGFVYSGTSNDNAYNCHSYAWYYGGNYNSQDKMKIYQPKPFFYDINYQSCYMPLYIKKTLNQISPSDVEENDIILFYAYADEGLETDSTYLLHSAIVDRVEGNSIIIREKNGPLPVNTCELSQSSFFLAEGGTHYNQGRQLSIYQPGHIVDSSWTLNQYYKVKNSASHYIACPLCGRGTDGTTEAHTFATVGSITRCTKCGYRVEIHSVTPFFHEEDD